MISRLHYITQAGRNGESHTTMMERACRAGVDWVQLRVKDEPFENFLAMGHEAREIAGKYGVRLIINDNVDLALSVNADGVHLGSKDMPVRAARQLLGQKKIIGGTANDLRTILALTDDGVDYIGLGPFRFTDTKKELSPVLGMDGYRRIMEELDKRGVRIPVIAIGGIREADVGGLTGTGVHGIAVASLINDASEPDERIARIKLELEQWVTS